MGTGVLEGKVAIITGAGRGIGAATAKLLAEQGAKVVIGEKDAEPGQAVVDAIVAAGGQAILVPGDVTKADYANTITDAAYETFGKLDILVNNAGYTWDGMVHKMSDEQWQAMMDIHLTAPFRLIRASARFLRDVAKKEIDETGSTSSRKVVNVSSISGTRGIVGQVNYSSGKAGLVGMTKTLAREWGPFNIQVNACAFGFIDTRLTQPKEAGEKAETGGKEIKLGIPANLRSSVFSTIPMGRPGTADEAAGAIFFFTSPYSNFVSGQVLEVTGGD